MKSYEKIAQILRADKDEILLLEQIMVERTSKTDVLDKIVEENEALMDKRIKQMSVFSRTSRDVYAALLAQISKDDKKLFTALNQPVCLTQIGCDSLLNAACKAAKIGKGFFLKEEKAREMIINTPPFNVMRTLGYSTASEMLEKENLFEVFSALRFVEDGKWLNEIFFSQYNKLTVKDFEKREIKTIVLGKKWEAVAQVFLKKKYHNISHLKELGVIFVLPAVLKISGETLRTLGLVLHYFHEIDFYSKLFVKYSKSDDFAEKFIAALRGDVADGEISGFDGKKWLIIQRYLAKDDENDRRLLIPHINPEAMHWRKAEGDIEKVGKQAGKIDMSFWRGLDWVGDFYPTESGVNVLVSFNLVDTVMALVKEKEMIKYLYHHQESLWNKIFCEYVGEKEMEEMMINNFEKGVIEL